MLVRSVMVGTSKPPREHRLHGPLACGGGARRPTSQRTGGTPGARLL